MNDKSPSEIFDTDRASSHDEKTNRIAAMKNALHLLTRMVLAELPANASILCVGPGTGAEIFYLASVFPNWRFTAVEPAKAMMDVCRQKAREQGIADRCTFHEGYLDALEQDELFDAATSFLVSQFLLDNVDRREFFRQIASYLRPEAYIINADLSSSLSGQEHDRLLDVWLKTMRFAGMPADPAVFGRDIAILAPNEVVEIISSSGFETPVQFCQTLFIHAWFAQRKPQ